MYMVLMISAFTCDLKLLCAVSWFNPFSSRPFIAEAQVRSQTILFGVCDGKVKLKKISFPEYFRFLLCIIPPMFHIQSAIPLFIPSFIHLFIHPLIHSSLRLGLYAFC